MDGHDMEEKDAFGFLGDMSFVKSQEELEDDRNDEDTAKAEKMFKMITPLLDHLCVNDHMDIHWPDRASSIKIFKEKLKGMIDDTA